MQLPSHVSGRERSIIKLAANQLAGTPWQRIRHGAWGLGVMGNRFCCDSRVWPKRAARLGCRSSGEAVELIGCGHGLFFGTVHLPLLDHVHGFDSANDDSGASK